MNKLWSTYGCEKCTTFQVLVLTVNFSDSKASFQSNFITPLGAKSVCVPKEDGGSNFNIELKNNNYGGPTYLICPDKSVIKSASEQTIKNKGIKPHICPGGGDLEAPKVTVTSPTASTILNVGAKHTITWTATDNVGVASRTISFSANNGTSWTKVDSSAGNTGSYSWTVPNRVSKTCKIKIAAYDSSKNVGTNESAVFEIQQPVGITTPATSRQAIAFKQTPEALMIFIPSPGEYEVMVTDVRGKRICGFKSVANKQWYTVSGSYDQGMRILRLKSSRETIVKELFSVK